MRFVFSAKIINISIHNGHYHNLTSITIPNSVTHIGNNAFYGCSGFTDSLTIPNSVTFIGNSAFRNCSGLTSVTIGSTVDTIGYYAFYNCSGLTSITIPNSVTYIGDNAFSYCTGFIGSLTIPNSINYIGGSAFSGCSGLTSITIPNSVTYIGSFVFSGCSGLITVNFNAINCYLGSSAFDNCPNLTTINIGNDVRKIQDAAFSGCSVTIVSIGNFLDTIGNYAFSGCSGLTSITIPNSVIYIGSNAFYNCSGLTSIIIPNSITHIGESAFGSCSALTNAIIGNSVDIIKHSTFSGCSKLATVSISNSIKSIEDYAFSGCNSLTEIKIDAVTPPVIYTNTFYNVPNSIPVYVPCGSVSAYQTASWWNLFQNIMGESTYQTNLLSNNLTMGTVTFLRSPCESDTVVFQAIANAGYQFTQWQDGNTDNPRTVVLTQDTSFTATFASDNIIYYTVTAIANNTAMGSVTGGGSYAANSTATLAAIPNTGYKFTQWSDGNTDNPRNITVTGNITLVANFADEVSINEMENNRVYINLITGLILLSVTISISDAIH